MAAYIYSDLLKYRFYSALYSFLNMFVAVGGLGIMIGTGRGSSSVIFSCRLVIFSFVVKTGTGKTS